MSEKKVSPLIQERVEALNAGKEAAPVVRKARAAWDAARAAAWDAARAAAWDALKPTVEALQVSALDLLDRMINPSEVPSE